jgi:hypothetical protein
MAELHVIPTAKTLKVGGHRRRSPKPAPKREPTNGLQWWTASGGAAIIGGLLAVSLTHLADGIALVTRCPEWQSLAVALSIDANLVFAEVALLVACAKAHEKIRTYAWVMITATLCASAALNSASFAHEATGWRLYGAIAFGIFIPTAIFISTKVAAGLVVHR